MKRVIPFLDFYDNIPQNAKYLFSRKMEFDSPETEDQTVKRIISNNPDELSKEKIVIYQHYYEVNESDFKSLIKSDFFKID